MDQRFKEKFDPPGVYLSHIDFQNHDVLYKMDICLNIEWTLS